MLSLFLLIPLAVLIVSDIACRNVSLWWLLGFGSLTISAGIACGGWEQMLLNAGGNIMAMAFVGGGLFLYSKVRKKRLAELLGLGDVLFLAIVSPLFGLMGFVRFVIVASLAGLLAWPVFRKLQPDKTGVPMVSVMGICFVVMWLSSGLEHGSYTCYSRPSILVEGERSATFTYNGAGDRVKMYVANGAAQVLTRYFIGARYEYDQTQGGTKERLYLGGDAYSAPMVYEREGNGDWSLYNIGRDYLGRGYTGHEHLTWFGFINMNARLYDPLLGRFLSPDPYVQAPDFTQNFNRYSYCLDNPLKYNDLDGELFGTISGFISDLFNNIFVRTPKMKKWDWTQTKLGLKIDMGLFRTDQNKKTGARIWEFVSRLTWQLPQTLVADIFVSGANAIGKVNDVTNNYGMTAVDMGLKEGAVTIGFYSAGPKGYKADWHDHLFVHEYGHYIQSQQHGLVYLFTVGIPSLQSAILDTDNPKSPNHDNRWFEADASYKGAAYFDKYYGSKKAGYFAGSPDYFDRNSFVAGGSSIGSPYVNPRTGLSNRTNNPVSGKFHWTDIPIYIPVVGLSPIMFYL